jgi:hypothetical protein
LTSRQVVPVQNFAMKRTDNGEMQYNQPLAPKRHRSPYSAGPDLGRSERKPMQPAPFAQVFYAGDMIPETGIYLISHSTGHQRALERLMPKGLSFPECSTCGTRVHFKLVRGAPSIWDDEDFAAAA